MSVCSINPLTCAVNEVLDRACSELLNMVEVQTRLVEVNHFLYCLHSVVLPTVQYLLEGDCVAITQLVKRRVARIACMGMREVTLTLLYCTGQCKHSYTTVHCMVLIYNRHVE